MHATLTAALHACKPESAAHACNPEGALDAGQAHPASCLRSSNANKQTKKKKQNPHPASCLRSSNSALMASPHQSAR